MQMLDFYVWAVLGLPYLLMYIVHFFLTNFASKI